MSELDITHVFAGLAVTDYDSALRWYERLLGRPPDRVPKQDEAVWQIVGSGLIYIVADKAHAGGGLIMFVVDDLEERLGELARRGLSTERIDTLPGIGRKAFFNDPDGNTITFAEIPGRES